MCWCSSAVFELLSRAMEECQLCPTLQIRSHVSRFHCTLAVPAPMDHLAHPSLALPVVPRLTHVCSLFTLHVRVRRGYLPDQEYEPRRARQDISQVSYRARVQVCLPGQLSTRRLGPAPRFCDARVRMRMAGLPRRCFVYLVGSFLCASGMVAHQSPPALMFVAAAALAPTRFRPLARSLAGSRGLSPRQRTTRRTCCLMSTR